jgi:putative effector of murein hydrolase LrgA (UPF0299 family)
LRGGLVGKGEILLEVSYFLIKLILFLIIPTIVGFINYLIYKDKVKSLMYSNVVIICECLFLLTVVLYYPS